MAPGVDLAQALVDISSADVDEAALVELVAGWERIVSWASAAQASVLGELLSRASSGREGELVPAQVAARLSTTGRAADVLVDTAVRLGRSPRVHDALAAGAIDVRKARVLVQQTAHLGLEAARGVQEAVLDHAPELTAPQLREAIRRTELTLDPDAAAERHQRAKADRCVRMTPAPDSMAWLTAFLPADDAMRVMTGIDAVAAGADPDDPRGIDARRADALVDTMAGVLDSGVGPHGPLATRQRRRPHLEVTASARSLLGLDADPATLAGYGPIPAAMARQIADGSSWRPVLVDAQTGAMIARGDRSYRPTTRLADDVTRRDVTCTFPGCRVPAARCDLDHVAPFDHERLTSSPAGGPEQTRYDNLQALCRFHHRLKTHSRWVSQRDPVTGATLWTAPTGHRYRRDPIPAEPLGSSWTADPPDTRRQGPARSNSDQPDTDHPDPGPPNSERSDPGPPNSERSGPDQPF